ncbi:Por secretion system C-terminal sorting domain-containing protein [Zobellia uliginosa]|uniref:Por secretion system C-terminal sorting domain-containing protein n=1 Tax=Zobellia uliginosa TaxID=143224 RepID=A0ABY1L3N2_9FLAO|nr:RICIN domain-containing protein [Zobellia uliginosa]SIT11635.1 Por secretion system C-terminal sorting domain-containing protein [Zobellia uliginosa]
MKKIVQSTILLSLFYSSVFGQLDTNYFNRLKSETIKSSDALEWVQFGPGMSGYCEFFWCHPTDPKTIHMSPDMFNAYGSFDAGKSWQTIKNYDSQDRGMGRTYDIEFSRQNQNFGFAIDEGGGVYRTKDKGRTWEKTYSINKAHSEIAVDPSNDNNWYIGAGSWWDVKGTHRTLANPMANLRSTAVSGHIYKSTDKGKTWKKISRGLPSTLSVAKIIVDPRNSNRIIMAANTGIYRSIDKGESWSPSKTGLPNNLPKDMTSYYNKGQNKFVLYVVEQTKYIKKGNTTTSKGGVYKSTDGGKSWKSITGDLGFDLTKITDPLTRSKYKRTVSNWLSIPTNQVGELPTQTIPTFHKIRVNPKNPQEIYLSHNVKHDFSFGPGGVWKTENGGKNWFPCARTGKYWTSGQDKSYWEGRGMPTGMNTTFAHLQPKMKKADGYFGYRFIEINSKGEIFTSIDQQILKSTDGGKKWKQIDDDETAPNSKGWVGRGGSNLPGRYILLDTGTPNRKLFCSGEHGLWESAPLKNHPNPNAVAVKQIEGQVNEPNAATSIGYVAVHPNKPNILYTIQFRQDHRDNFRRSIDGGKTWENISTPIDHPDTNLSGERIFSYSILIDPVTPKNIYFCVIRDAPAEVNSYIPPGDFNKFGVYKSTDGGFSWKVMNNGFPQGASVRRLEMHPTNSSVIYAASNFSSKNKVPGGLYKTTNKAASWSKVEIPAAIKSVNNVHIDETTKHIYISCGRKSGTYDEGGIWRSKDGGASWEKIFDLPYVWQTETSPINPNIIIASVPWNSKAKNLGAYLSRNGGKNWIKINKNLAHPDAITDIRPDNKDENTFWCAGWGSGWYKGVLKNQSTSQLIEDGTYYVKSVLSDQRLLARELESHSARMANPGDYSDQQWVFTHLKNNIYHIKNKRSNRYLEVPFGKCGNGNDVATQNSKSLDHQKWKVLKNSSNKYSFKPIHCREVALDISDGALNANVHTWKYSYANKNQQWELIAANAGKSDFSSKTQDILKVFPNPAKNNIAITGVHYGDQINVYSMLGTLIESKIASQDKEVMDISYLTSGLYIISVPEKGSITFVKE